MEATQEAVPTFEGIFVDETNKVLFVDNFFATGFNEGGKLLCSGVLCKDLRQRKAVLKVYGIGNVDRLWEKEK